MSARRVVVLTHFPSPYQVELFDAVERLRPGEISVCYLHRSDAGRHWSERTFRHRASFLDEAGALDGALRAAADADFLVLNYYDDRRAVAMLRARERSRRPWCFWGERPGFIHPGLGRLRRRWTLRSLHRSKLPVWGVGAWAIDAYRREFGAQRPYVNMPYFSDLARFTAQQPAPPGAEFVLLYSGSLSRRKGVDLLAEAFARLAAVQPNVRLRLMGRGELEDDVRRRLARVSDRVEWVGFRHWEDLPAVYGSAHLLCVPSRHDGWGLVVAEGLATGLPVIASDRVGAAIDLLRPGESGWSCAAGSIEQLLEAMRDAAAMTPQEWRAKSAAARASVAAHGLAEGARRFVAAVDCGIEAGTAA